MKKEMLITLSLIFSLIFLTNVLGQQCSIQNIYWSDSNGKMLVSEAERTVKNNSQVFFTLNLTEDCFELEYNLTARILEDDAVYDDSVDDIPKGNFIRISPSKIIGIWNSAKSIAEESGEPNPVPEYIIQITAPVPFNTPTYQSSTSEDKVLQIDSTSIESAGTISISSDYVSCPEDQTILRLSSATNAHGEIYNGNGDYPHRICYNKIFGLKYTGGEPHECTSTADGPNDVINLFSQSNSHASESLNQQYTVPICYGDLDCTTRNNEDCQTGEKLVISLFYETNAHLANDSSYVRRICCRSTFADTGGAGVTPSGEPSTPIAGCTSDSDCSDGWTCSSGVCIFGEELPGDCNTSAECDDGESCAPVRNGGGDLEKQCILAGIWGCEGYDDKDSCNAFDWWAAENSIESVKGDNFCSDKYCECSWNNNKKDCEPAFTPMDTSGNLIADQKCIFSTQAKEETCVEGFKAITYTSAAACLDGGTNRILVPCFVPSEVPFFGIFSLIVSAGLLVLFYLKLR